MPAAVTSAEDDPAGQSQAPPTVASADRDAAWCCVDRRALPHEHGSREALRTLTEVQRSRRGVAPQLMAESAIDVGKAFTETSGRRALLQACQHVGLAADRAELIRVGSNAVFRLDA